MKSHGIVLGFHGCDKSLADRLVAGETEVKVSNNQHDWLGAGAYFWENNPVRALAWAQFLANNPRPSRAKIATPSVVGAIIATGNCLDLTEQTSLDLIKQAYTNFVRLCESSSTQIPVNEAGFKGDEDYVKRYLDCAVLNFLHELRLGMALPTFDTIRAPFFEGGELFPGSKLSAKAHVQWCVRDPKRSIIGYFRPKNEHSITF
jgi:hypothetical protein